MSSWFKGCVTACQHWNNRHFSLTVNATGYPEFIAGQFTRLALVVDGFQVARPYSFVNPPRSEQLEFYASVIPDGELTPQLFRLKAGDTVLINEKPNGFLILDEIPHSRDLWLIATGTGIGPFLSILQTPEPWQRFEHIVLVHGVRHGADRAYREILSRLATQYPSQFQWVDLISRERVPGTLYGRIPAAIDNNQLEAAAGLRISPEHSQFMLCGNPQMILDVTATLGKRGLTKNLRKKPGQITSEKYW